MTATTEAVSVGIVANPASGRDIRRLVAKASVFPTAEKANMVQRLLTSLAAVGVPRALLSTDLGGISSALVRAARTRRGHRDPAWPELEFVATERITGTGADTLGQVGTMVEAGARVIVCLGGDGTARLAADACGDVPLLALSTGTNNVYPVMREATVAGLAAGLVAVGALDDRAAVRRQTALEVKASGQRELALVDVAVAATRHIGSRALWDPADLRTLVCTFAEPDGIGLSSIAGLLCPSPRDGGAGVVLRLAPVDRARHVVRAPIAPGLVVPVGVDEWRPIEVGASVVVEGGGVVAVDGEREIELSGTEPAVVTLLEHGPRAVDVAAVLAAAARRGLMSRPPDTPPRVNREKEHHP